ncbi:MAG: YebC/PmpR family DNA-binding transcriptional regulator [Chloroflexi bacterium]|nr:YebC/PmpR family DNA-binding transcriptional regulator [Chloroflexota bacterium]
MAGHSKWAQIKRQKGVADQRRGQIFTRLAREITLAARQGGGNPDANFRLRLAVDRARASNMPAENIERAIRRATGEGDAAALEEVSYEGYGPNGIAILVQAVTDNRNRTVAEVRNVFARGGGNLGESGSVAWLFDERGVITVDARGKDPEDLALVAIDAGAEDFKLDQDTLEVHTRPEDLDAVRSTLAARGLELASAELALVPKTTVSVDERTAAQVLRLLDRLEELDDVQKVYSNADFPEEVLVKLAS